MWELESKIAEIHDTIQANDGRNVANSAFIRYVDELLSIFYDDIGELKSIQLRSLFELFLIKTLYINRRSTDAKVIDYLADMLTRFLWARELLPGATTAQLADLLAVLMQETEDRTHYQNLFEAYRKVGDNALFITGMFPRSLERRRTWALRRRRTLTTTPYVDRAHYTDLGKRHYQLASNHELAYWTGQHRVLAKLADHFEIYREALNELSERYVLGFDLNIIADKMLDYLNLYRRTGDEHHLETARKYAALLAIDPSALAKVRQRRSIPPMSA